MNTTLAVKITNNTNLIFIFQIMGFTLNIGVLEDLEEPHLS